MKRLLVALTALWGGFFMPAEAQQVLDRYTAVGRGAGVTGFRPGFKVYSPEQFGTVACDGSTTDDTVAIQAAVDAAAANGTVRLSGDCIYKITSTITVAHDYHYWIGGGAGSTRIVYEPTADGCAISVTKGTTTGNQFGMEGIEIRSADSTFFKTAICINDYHGVELTNVKIKGDVLAPFGGTNLWSGGGSRTFTASTSDNLTIPSAVYDVIATGDQVTVSNSGGALPTGLSAATTYFAIKGYAGAIDTATQINTGTDALTVPADFYAASATGDQVVLATTGTIATSTPQLAVRTTYYVIKTGTANEIKLAISLANAQAGTAIDITAAGTGTLYFYGASLSNYIRLAASFADAVARVPTPINVTAVGSGTQSLIPTVNWSVGLRLRGRDFNYFTNMEIAADKPVFIQKNVNWSLTNIPGTTDIDHTEFINSDFLANINPTITLDNGVNVSQLSFSGRQAWSLASHGFYWVNHYSTASSTGIKISNVRTEQGKEAAAYSVYIANWFSTQDVKIDKFYFDSGRNAVWLRGGGAGTGWFTIDQTVYPGTGTAIDAEGPGISTLVLLNTFWQVGSTATLTNLVPSYSAAKNPQTGPLPGSAFYMENASTTAGIFNGTIGAVTPNTGAFTTITGAFNGTVGATTPSTIVATTIGTTGTIIAGGQINANAGLAMNSTDTPASFSSVRTNSGVGGVDQGLLISTYFGENDAGTAVTYATHEVTTSVATAGAHSGRHIFRVAAAGSTSTTILVFNGANAALYPNTNDAISLGLAANSFSDLFLAAGGVINWANGQNTITATSADLLTIGGSALSITLGTASTSSTTGDLITTGGAGIGGALNAGTFLAAATYAQVGTKIRAVGAAPALSACGTSPAIEGSDLSGTVTMGTATPTSCTITFNVAYTAAPRCSVTWRVNIASMQYAVSTTAITLTQTATSSNVVDYICTARTGG